MRKIPANEAGRSSPTLSGPTTPTGTGAGTVWASGSGVSFKPTTPGRERDFSLSPWSSAEKEREKDKENQYRYSREFILSLFDKAWPVPMDFDEGTGMTTEVVLEPMANIPLTEHEKKLFTSQSVNSEISARRPTYGRQDSKDGVRPPRAPGSGQRGYSNRQDRGSTGENYRPTRRGDTGGPEEDPWDTPSGVGVGSFNVNGMFSRDDYESGRNPNDSKEVSMLFGNRGRESPDRSASPVPINKSEASSPGKPAGRAPSPAKPGATEQSIGGVTSAAPGTLAGGAIYARNDDDPARPVPRTASFVDIFNSFGTTGLGTSTGATTAAIKSDLLPSLGLGRHTPDPINPPSMVRSLSKGDLNQPATMPPPGIAQSTPFVPQKWQYKDPAGNVQGPFTPQQMHEWFRSGYFNDDLPIKHVDDFNYEPLARLIHRFGRERPFLADMEEAEQQHTAQVEQQRRFGGGIGLPGTPGYKDLYPKEATTPGSVGFNPFGAFANTPGTPSLYTPNSINTDPFAALGGRDRFGSYDALAGGSFGRPTWNENQGLARPGWGSLNSDLASPFTRGGVAPGSPAGSLTGSYFDQRGGQATPQEFMGIMGQRQATSSFGGFSGQQSIVAPAPQSPAAGLFSAQPILDFAGTTQGLAGTSEWGSFGLGSRIGGGVGAAGGVTQYVAEESHAPIDVVSQLIDDGGVDQSGGVGEQGEEIVERFAALDVGGIIGQDKYESDDKYEDAEVKVKEVEKKPRKVKKEEKVERAEIKPIATQVGKEKGVDSASSSGQPAIDLRQIMSEQETRSRREKEKAALEKTRQMEREAEDERIFQQQSKSGQNLVSSAWSTAEQPKLSLKEIQELEQREREKEERERQRRAHEALVAEAAMIQEQEMSGGQSWGGDGKVWGAAKPSGPVRQKSLAEIMEEEEKRKRREGEKSGVSEVVVSGGGKRYADTIGVSGGPVWGGVPSGVVGVGKQGGGRVVVASGNVVKAQPLSSVGGRPDESVAGAWNVVGKQGQVVRPPAPVVRPPVPPTVRPSVPAAPRIVSVNVAQPVSSGVSAPTSSTPTAATGTDSKSPSTAFMQWCRGALKPLERSTSAGVNVDAFIQILLSISPTDSGTIQMICDDTLGGLTAIDPRKFAEEFGKKRRADLSGEMERVSGSNGGSNGLEVFESGNKFVVVKGGKKKKGRK